MFFCDRICSQWFNWRESTKHWKTSKRKRHVGAEVRIEKKGPQRDWAATKQRKCRAWEKTLLASRELHKTGPRKETNGIWLPGQSLRIRSLNSKFGLDRWWSLLLWECPGGIDHAAKSYHARTWASAFWSLIHLWQRQSAVGRKVSILRKLERELQKRLDWIPTKIRDYIGTVAKKRNKRPGQVSIQLKCAG
jgi:hypothetical protein